MPINPDAVIQNIGFHDVDYHSGEVYDLTDWEGVVTDEPECEDHRCIVWSTQTYEENPTSSSFSPTTKRPMLFDLANDIGEAGE